MTSNLLAALKSNQARNNIVNISPLIEAAKNGQVAACLRALDEPKIKVDQRDSDGATSLMHASARGYLEVVRTLVDKGARVSLLPVHLYLAGCCSRHKALHSPRSDFLWLYSGERQR